MTSTPSRALGLDALAEVSEAVESGAGLPEVTRAAGRAIESSVIVLDASASVLAVACASPDDERAVMAGESGAQSGELRVADTPVGELRHPPRGGGEPVLLRLVANLIALELERSKAPARASEAAVRDFISDVLARKVTDRENILARGEELGADLSLGASVLVVRARPQQPAEGDWRGRLLTVAQRGAPAIRRSCVGARGVLGWGGQGGGRRIVWPGSGPPPGPPRAVAGLRGPQ